MVVSLMRWMPWQPISSKKFEVMITVHRLIGLEDSSQEDSKFSVEIKWKGSKGKALGSLRKISQRRNLTRQETMKEDGVVSWDEDFWNLCKFSSTRNDQFQPWEVSFTVFPGLSEETDSASSIPVFPSASLNLADFIDSSNRHDKEISIPLLTSTDTSSIISLHVSVTLLELRNSENVTAQRNSFHQRYPSHERVSATTKDQPNRRLSPIRMDIFRGFSALRANKGRDEDSSDSQSTDNQLDISLDFGSFHEADESESDFSFRKTFNYGTIAYANQAGASSSSEDEDWIYYTGHQSVEKSVYREKARTSVPVSDHPVQKKSKLRYLTWGKRKSTSAESKGEPLLKKHYGEDGGDDIDFDRRQVKRSMPLDRKSTENPAAEQLSEFGDDNFAVGTWENKEIISRDGQMKLKAQVFFASIDQRSERVAGESACTTLVAVIADWFHTNPKGETPIKSQLDALIREGSQEWRNLCGQEAYAQRFPDKHFDLETVLEAKIRPISVIHDKSFVGFFHPEGIEQQQLHLLEGAMSFDNIWDEIRESASKIPPGGDLVYIISWNDHFFVLKVEPSAYYIIDTLGERLHEGCDQAFILKFDEDTVIQRNVNETQNADKDDKMEDESSTKLESGRSSSSSCSCSSLSSDEDDQKETEEGTQVSTGKECCRDYIKSFLAAIPIRELQDDLEKGRMTSTPIHHRLQIECHYTSHCWNNE